MVTYCLQCGQPRAGDARFCDTCGHEFREQPGGSAPGEPPPAGVAGETRWDAPAPQTVWDRPPAEQWNDMAPAQQWNDMAPAEQWNDMPPADQWGGADTVYAPPGGSAGYAPAGPSYAPPGSPYAPPAPDPGQRPGNRMTTVFIVIAVLVVLAAGGGAYALASSHGTPTAQPSGTPTVTGPAGPTDTTPVAPTTSASATPTTPSPSVSVTPTPAHTGTVQVAAAAAANPAAPQVEAYLNRYFSAINSRNYAAYQSLLDAQMQAGNSRSTFDSGYATTKDSNEVLTGIEDTGGGHLTADVSFTSQQSPADSVDSSACNNWRISLFLVPQGSSYVLTAAPAGYHAAYTDC